MRPLAALALVALTLPLAGCGGYRIISDDELNAKIAEAVSGVVATAAQTATTNTPNHLEQDMKCMSAQEDIQSMAKDNWVNPRLHGIFFSPKTNSCVYIVQDDLGDEDVTNDYVALMNAATGEELARYFGFDIVTGSTRFDATVDSYR